MLTLFALIVGYEFREVSAPDTDTATGAPALAWVQDHVPECLTEFKFDEPLPPEPFGYIGRVPPAGPLLHPTRSAFGCCVSALNVIGELKASVPLTPAKPLYTLPYSPHLVC